MKFGRKALLSLLLAAQLAGVQAAEGTLPAREDAEVSRREDRRSERKQGAILRGGVEGAKAQVLPSGPSTRRATGAPPDRISYVLLPRLEVALPAGPEPGPDLTQPDYLKFFLSSHPYAHRAPPA